MYYTGALSTRSESPFCSDDEDHSSYICIGAISILKVIVLFPSTLRGKKIGSREDRRTGYTTHESDPCLGENLVWYCFFSPANMCGII